MKTKRKFDSHVTISTTTTTTETKRVKIDGSDDGYKERGIQKIGRAITERLRPYEEVINTGDVDVDVGISIDGKGKASINLDLQSTTSKLLTRHLHTFLRTLLVAHEDRLDHDYDAADREVMAGKGSPILYAKVMTRHLEALTLFRAYGPEGLKFACAFMLQIAMRLFGVEGPAGNVKVENSSVKGRGSSPDKSPEEQKVGGQVWGTDEAKRKELYRLFDYHMNKLFKERDAMGRRDRRWISVYAVNLKEMRRRADEQGLGRWYFSGSITFLEEAEGRCGNDGDEECEKEEIGSLEEWEDEESESEDRNESNEEEEERKSSVLKEVSRSRSCSTELDSRRSSVEPKMTKVERGHRDGGLFY